ncbi:MAG: TetR/AcrR family transcriptional regulator [Chloroflexota bacterium]|nr:TetR/AcrR family transcriptional regulator [Chloroflexota bacterium]
MPPRDERDFENKRQQIIRGALEAFASKGYERATNRDIAVAAKIGSPGLIYHYFKDKTDLFKQVVEAGAPALQFIARGDDLMDLPPDEVLTNFALTFVQMMENRSAIALLKVMLSEAARHAVVAEAFNKVGPGRGFAFLNRYLSHQMDLGRLRRVDPGAATRCFVGPLIAFMLTREIFVQPDAHSLMSADMVRTTVEIFLQGMSTDD